MPTLVLRRTNPRGAKTSSLIREPKQGKHRHQRELHKTIVLTSTNDNSTRSVSSARAFQILPHLPAVPREMTKFDVIHRENKFFSAECLVKNINYTLFIKPLLHYRWATLIPTDREQTLPRYSFNK